MKSLSQRTKLQESGIRRMYDLAKTKQDVISFVLGEPDFTTPQHIIQAAKRALDKGLTHYTDNAGILPLRKAIAGYLAKHDGVTYDPVGEIMVSTGAMEIIYLCFSALLDPGDEVLIPEPCFVCYEPLSRMAGGVAVPLVTRAEDGFRLTAAALRAAITPRTKMLVLPFPNNPTGGVMRREHLEEIAEVLRGTEIMVLSDEIYGELTYGEREHVSITSLPDMQARTLLVGGFSKAFAMTGWRLGYVCGPQPLMAAIVKLHQYALMCAPTTAQYAAIEAMEHGDEDVTVMRAEYDLRRRFIVDELNRMGLTCFEPEGAFYVFPSIRITGMTSEDFCQKLLMEKHVAVVPGTAFGESGEGFVRISYCYSLKHITEAMERLRAFIAEHAGDAE